jgi:hypothetical protein
VPDPQFFSAVLALKPVEALADVVYRVDVEIGRAHV